jgi:dihydrofolate reductase
MRVSIIAAMDQSRTIGSTDGAVPWDLPRDREYFRAYTKSKWLAIGRKTYEEMEGWFSDHTPIVITERDDYQPHSEGHHTAYSVEAAISLAAAMNCEELVFCGGSQIYAAALPSADRLLLTRIDFRSDGDLLFPEFESSGEWHQSHSEYHSKDAENPHALRFEIWDKKH